YPTALPEGSEDLAVDAIAQGIDVAAFTSSSTVKNLARLLGGNLGGLNDAMIACIGPITAATAGELGLSVDIVASEHTIDGLVNAMEDYFNGGGDEG
ncbi:MAG: uroporphyrinogen-III synthase, partial [Chloroflexi bacterium]|nr:uroporphyrinogen-III synthase [Chloroflexota bacterium]